jgi:hypothetical protein
LIAVVLWRAPIEDPEQRGYWLDFIVLLAFGLSRRVSIVRVRMAATSARIRPNKSCLDAGLYAFSLLGN